MIRIDVRHDIRKLTEHLTWLQKEEIPYATSVAINESLKKAAPAVQAEMRQVFDRPTPWTLNSYRILKYAKKRQPTGIVGFKDMENIGGRGTSAGKYLQPQMAGGPRPAKGLERLLRSRGILGNNEFLVPSKFMKLDQYGNVSRGTVQKVLANLQATRDPYSRTPSGGARGGKKKADFFFTRKGVRGQRHTMIWQSFGAKGAHNAVPAFIVVAGAPQYRQRFDQRAVVERVVAQSFPQEFDNAMLKALATSRNR